ncbi:hypothetical protein AAFM46_10915 [Arthrobacter sp. TMP15]|uniref:hypothetical protein n=1 Tax=Arthrobacter sp. TMP15 TaxID=3140789 RepID=UPI0031BA72F2
MSRPTLNAATFAFARAMFSDGYMAEHGSLPHRVVWDWYGGGRYAPKRRPLLKNGRTP